MQSLIAGIRTSPCSSVRIQYTSFAPVCITSVRTPNAVPSSSSTCISIRSAIKYSSFFNFTACSLVTYRLFPLYFSMSLILSMSLNFRITNCLKNFTPSISRPFCSLPVSRITCFNFLNRSGSSVVGNTFTSPRIP